MLNEIGQFISTVGFPIAVASYFIWRMNGKIDRLTNAIEKLIKHQLKERRRANDLDDDELDILTNLENGGKL
jgi:hypothetical protein